MKKLTIFIVIVIAAVLLVACGNKSDSQEEVKNDKAVGDINEVGPDMSNKMIVQVGNYEFTATLENNEAVKELIEMMKKSPVELKLEDYSGFEKVGPLGKSLTRNDSQTTTNKGDIVLYNGNNIVVFYGSNSWSYTRIGKIDDTTNLEKALGSGEVTAIFKIAD